MKNSFIVLYSANLHDMLEAAGIKRGDRRIHAVIFRFLAALAFFIPALYFTLLLRRFDAKIGREGLRPAADWLLKQFYAGAADAAGSKVSGNVFVPAGPLLILSNHPGIGDSMALLSVLPRPDVKILVADKPFFRALPNLSKLLFLLGDNVMDRARLADIAVKYLVSGGCLLLYPAGKIEPDPMVYPEVSPANAQWSSLVGYITLRCSEAGVNLPLQAVKVSGIFPALEAKAGILPPDWEERGQRIALRILLFRLMKKHAVRISAGCPAYSAELLRSDEAAAEGSGKALARYIAAKLKRSLYGLPV
ncbi:MAG: hypothetical protein E4H36_08120 [Spirochaetales bacterium]|nr:MAG: hypothetical protein E4H36_08120 [Spirochaetales bacterium]